MAILMGHFVGGSGEVDLQTTSLIELTMHWDMNTVNDFDDSD